MATNVINAELLAKMFLAGAKNLESKKEYINELNVFPVPDGDTGTNMTLTIMSAAKELNNLGEKSMQTACKAISSGSLRGARGNSGVILSQLIRGFTKVAQEYDEITICGLVSSICVMANVQIIHALYSEIPITFVENASAGLSPEDHEAACRIMRDCQINVVSL